MNFRGRFNSAPIGFQIAPLVDIFLVLLIFFIVTWTLAKNETELDVKVPTAKEGKDSNRMAGEVILNVKADGTVILNRQRLSPEALQNTLQRISKLYPDQAVVLRGDEKVDYRHVVDVLDICRKVNIWNVAFATSRPE